MSDESFGGVDASGMGMPVFQIVRGRRSRIGLIVSVLIAVGSLKVRRNPTPLKWALP